LCSRSILVDFLRKRSLNQAYGEGELIVRKTRRASGEKKSSYLTMGGRLLKKKVYGLFETNKVGISNKGRPKGKIFQGNKNISSCLKRGRTGRSEKILCSSDALGRKDAPE